MMTHDLPIDLTFGVHPNTLPWMSFLWLATVFGAGRLASKAAVDAALAAKGPPSKSVDDWLALLWYAQLCLSITAGVCHLLTFTQLQMKLVNPFMAVAYLASVVVAWGIFLFSTATGDAEVSRVSEHRRRAAAKGATSNTGGAPSKPRFEVLLQSLSLLAPAQWRVLSVLTFITFMYVLTTGFSFIVRLIPFALVFVTTAGFLLCTAAVCRDPLSEQSAEFALAAAGVVIAGTPSKFWTAAPTVGNIIVAAAALHMLLSLTGCIPRPILKPDDDAASPV